MVMSKAMTQRLVDRFFVLDGSAILTRVCSTFVRLSERTRWDILGHTQKEMNDVCADEWVSIRVCRCGERDE